MTRSTWTVVLALFAGALAEAKPMTADVTSWEGTFELQSPCIAINAKGGPPLSMWLYRLDQGSKGTAIGFSTSDGDMIWAPRPQQKGVQPLYSGHCVFIDAGGTVEVIVTYDVQGNGGMRMAEKYVFDGKSVRLVAQSTFFGKIEPEWKRTDGESQGVEPPPPAVRSPRPAP